MSAQVRNATTDEFVGVAWSSGQGGASFDWGACTERAFQWCEQADRGEMFVADDGREWTGEEFVAWVTERTWTFGEFGGTFEVGSGDMATWEGM